MPLRSAIYYGRTMEASVREGILTEFIQRHGSEVRNMLYTEFNLEDAREV